MRLIYAQSTFQENVIKMIINNTDDDCSNFSTIADPLYWIFHKSKIFSSEY